MESMSPRCEKGGSVVLIFGSQALDFNHETASPLRTAILGNPDLAWVENVITELRDVWDVVADKLPELTTIPGSQQLDSLIEWLRRGSFPGGASAFPLPNIVLTPLVVITHLVQYTHFRQLDPKCSDTTKTLGLCTGLLSAAAVSHSANNAQLRRYGAIAVRIAMLIGALVDAQDIEDDGGSKWASHSVMWASGKLDASISQVLTEFSEAYLSVIPDENRATATSRRADVATLQQRLKALGFITADIGLHGSFHSSKNETMAEALIRFCAAHTAFQFPDVAEAVIPTCLVSNGKTVKSGLHHEHVIRSILTELADWQSAFAELKTISVGISFGLERCVPGWFSRKLGTRLVHLNSLNLPSQKERLKGMLASAGLAIGPQQHLAMDNDSVAIIGMSCLLPGAADLEEFWDLLCRGESQHTEAPADRFNFETAWREVDPSRKWYGNFIDGHDAFDHKFFKKSPREMSSTDPQHRLMLQAAYQAVEQSGYFNNQSRDKHIGCYIGVGLVDYENNIACYPANAYAATGNLKSFAAGKISHYFGWTGPGLTIDTACSSSAVAVHTACRAILTGECSGALVGGVNIMTSPEWFQNLAGASFLSPTGQCKPFDANADGYCRAEAVGAVFIKKLSAAIADGDQVLGVIAASGVYQNENCTAITVPNAPSLSGLFQDVVQKAGLEPKDVSVVEAHGTGTPVGDPAEYDSVRRVFGGSSRPGGDSLALSSVKGLLGHSESASGIVALLKVLLMIIKGFVPPQASFKTINPSIAATPADRIEIPTKLRPWDVEFRAALINNYGASGSNASLVITQDPRIEAQSTNSVLLNNPSGAKYPIWLCGFDERSLRAYAAKLATFLASQKHNNAVTLSNISFQISRQSNRNLAQSLILSCNSMTDLEEKLTSFASGKDEQKDLHPTIRRDDARPVVLCFGGQISTFVGLNKEIHDSFAVFRNRLNEVNNTCMSLGLKGIYPTIFQKSPVEDIVALQTSLFAMQYSCAMSWIDCGVKVATLVGHSFGELTAMCVSGMLSLHDALKMVSGRASIIQDDWTWDRGDMVAVEADLHEIEDLLEDASQKTPKEAIPATIACFNGPRSFTLAGSVAAIDAVMKTAKGKGRYSNIKMKELDVSHAFHSAQVDGIVPKLRDLGRQVILRDPQIPLERAVADGHVPSRYTSDFVAEHLRNPVYFNHAVRRVAKKYLDGCIWLEAGSNSTITTMAARALRSLKTSHFQPVNINANNAFNLLTDTTVNLWQEGLPVSFWAHDAVQSLEYPTLLLPPYQFEKVKHWMQLKKPQKQLAMPAMPAAAQPTEFNVPQGVWTFVGYQDSNGQKARFQINAKTQEYQKYVSGHVIAEAAPICPSTYQLVIAIDALASLMDDPKCEKLKPELQGMVSHSPMVMDASKLYWLDAEQLTDSTAWDWRIIGAPSEAAPLSSNTTLFVTGRIVFKNTEASQEEFARYRRLIQHKRCLSLLNGNAAEGAIIGSRNIYKAFSDIVQYKHRIYHGLNKLVFRGSESAGCVSQMQASETWLNLGLADSFCQVAGICLNSVMEKPEEDMFISDRIDQWIRSPTTKEEGDPAAWDVLACHSRSSDQECISDVFIFDQRNGELVEVILGIHYVRVSRPGMAKLLTRLSGGKTTPPRSANLTSTETATVMIENGHPKSAQKAPEPVVQTQQSSRQRTLTQPDVAGSLRDLVCNLSGLEPAEVQLDAKLVDLGIDSLMGMELASEIQNLLNCKLDMADLLDLTDFQSLVTCIKGVLGLNGALNGHSHTNEEPVEPAHTNGVNGAHLKGYTNGVNGHQSRKNGSPGVENISIPASVMLEAFKDTKGATDRFIEENGFADYVKHILPKSNELCVVHILDAFDQLGCSIRGAKQGQPLQRIEYLPRHEQFVKFIYDLLRDHGLVEVQGSSIMRTAKPVPAKSAAALLQEMIDDNPAHAFDHKLTSLTGCKLADCLTGKADGLQLVFASAEGRETVSGMYGKSPINVAWIRQMEHLLREFFLRLPKQDGPIKILEMGSGTGGTTANLIPVLASLGIPFRYSVTDLSPSLVAAARKRFKAYPFMDFQVLDIENPPADLIGSQHLILATNCVHATHSLVESTRNIHRLLRPDGFLMMLEMTQTIPWIDLVFGLIEGWWLFNDGRRHALQPPEVWDRTMRSVGYGHVDWTDGERPEAAIQRIIIASASSPDLGSERVQHDKPPFPLASLSTDQLARQGAVDAFVEKYTRDLALGPEQSVGIGTDSDIRKNSNNKGHCVLVTGGTGSLGSQLVAHFSALPDVWRVICLNRRSVSTEDFARQMTALTSRGLHMSPEQLGKLTVLASDTSKPELGLSHAEYTELASTVTNIVHNAWPMSLTRPVDAFEPQFRTMRGLLQLAGACVTRRTAGMANSGPSRIGFLFVSSIATVGYYPLWSGRPLAPENAVGVESVLPNGYGDAKLVCERMVDAARAKYTASDFHATVVRIGQISGSTTSGYWNPVEHLAFLIKSAQTVGALPDFDGTLSWCPVDVVAATLGDLLLGTDESYPVYHVENPQRQPWHEMVHMLAAELGVSKNKILPFAEWLIQVREFSGSSKDNPASALVDFLAQHFIRMSCGGLILDTARSQEHSDTLRQAKPVSTELVKKYVESWKTMGFLNRS